jgi:Rad51
MGLDNPLISNDTASQLRKSKIYSVFSLLDYNDNRLPANLEIPALKQKLIDSGPKEKSLVDVPFPKIFRTGILGLDKLQDLVPGKVYEFCGHSATGKTQICNTIAVNLAEKYLCEVFYVNTRDNFSSARVHSILQAKGFDKSVGVSND